MYRDFPRTRNPGGAAVYTFPKHKLSFCSIFVCKVRNDWQEMRQLGYFSTHARPPISVILLTVTEDTPVEIGLFQPGLRCWLCSSRVNWCFLCLPFGLVLITGSMQNLWLALMNRGEENPQAKQSLPDMRVVIFKGRPQPPHYIWDRHSEPVILTERDVSEFVGHSDFLKKGEYTIVPLSFHAFHSCISTWLLIENEPSIFNWLNFETHYNSMHEESPIFLFA